MAETDRTGKKPPASGDSGNPIVLGIEAGAGDIGAAGGGGPIVAAGASADAQTVGALHQISETGHWLGVIVNNLTDRHMWISLGWFFLGWGLLGFGFFLLVSRTQLWKNIRSTELTVAKTAATAAL